ncbi:MAG: efflux RND transporter periplasmic adaptor subunit [Gemmatimonadetes bacterium]|nr:efflux RND transporter periplasmic adaptor subunit [Gemmatimonadota bacterium]
MTSHHNTRGFAMSGYAPRTWALVGLVTVGFLGGCAAEEETTAEAAATLVERPIVLGQEDVAVATMADLVGGVIITGSLQPAYMAVVKAQVPGAVTNISVDRGTSVGQGQPIATIEAAGVRAQAAAAEANLALARQRLESARTLREAGALSALDFQVAQAGYQAAEAQAAGAKEMAQRATIRSPIAGIIAERTVEEGEAVGMNDPLFTVVRSDVLELAGAVPVDAAGQIRPGQVVVFTLSAFPGREFRGEVARVEPVADPSTRQVGVYLRMRNPGGLIGGQFATGQVLGQSTTESVVVPESAVRGDGPDAYVLVIEGGRAVRRAVAVGATDPTRGLVGIASGMEAGAQVIITPTAAITEGARVEVGGASAAAPAGPGQRG